MHVAVINPRFFLLFKTRYKSNHRLKVPELESPVAYDKSATLGSTPNAAAVSAEEIAIEANSSLVGSVFIAQSPNTNTFP